MGFSCSMQNYNIMCNFLIQLKETEAYKALKGHRKYLEGKDDEKSFYSIFNVSRLYK